MTVRVEHIGDATLYLADCRDILPTLSGVDAVVTDPPYGVEFAGSATKHSKRDGNSYASFEDTPENVACICVPAVRLAVSLSRSAAVTPGQRCAHLYDTPVDQGAIFYPSGANIGPWGFICSQPIFYYGKDPFLEKGLGSRPNGFSTTESAEKNGHPCPKPIGQMKWLVNRVSFEGETVMDPFMGSGTTGVACVKLGRKFIGVEIEEKYFSIACRRIEEAYRQGDLFVPAPKVSTEPPLLPGV
jgi:site-specific DNA-methyltransferase (adenine-specific)